MLPILVTGNGPQSLGRSMVARPYLQSVHFQDTTAQNGDIVSVSALKRLDSELALRCAFIDQRAYGGRVSQTNVRRRA